MKKYLTTRILDNQKYAEEIHARSLSEAKAICRSSGTILEGEHFGDIPAVTGGMVIDFIIKQDLVMCRSRKPIEWKANAIGQLGGFLNNPRKVLPEAF
jgi:hypothetical protein